MYPVFVKTYYYDEIEQKNVQKIFLIYAAKLVDAAETIVQYVGDSNIFRVEFIFFAEEGTLIEVDQKFVDENLRGE